MSEMHTIKLNLRALQQDAPQDKSASTPKTIDAEDSTNNWNATDKQDIQETKPEVAKIDVVSAKMSFASIRKESEEKTEEAPKQEISNEDIIENEEKNSPLPIETSLEVPDIKTETENNDELKLNIEEWIKTEGMVDDSTGGLEDQKAILESIMETEATDNKKKNLLLKNKKKPITTEGESEVWSESPEEIEAILASAENAVTEKKKKKFFWIFKRKKTTKIEKISEVEEEEKKVQFTNYESHFTKESSNFLSKFQKFKYTPKTRVWLIIGLVCITSFIIWGLMVLIPDKHSPDIYKASLIQILNKEEITWNTSIKEEVIHTPNIKEKEIEEAIIPETTKQEESKEKLRQHLLNKYSG